MSRLSLQIGALCLAAVSAGAVRAQNPPAAAGSAGQDSGMMPMRRQGAGRPMLDQGRRQRLMQMIQERFAQRVKLELGLTDQQMERLRTVLRENRDRRLQVQERERDLQRAVNEQMRPGIAADQDSLSRLLDAIAANHVARDQLDQQEQRELAQFLTPVQRARLLYMRQMLLQRIESIREGRFRAQPGRAGAGSRPAPEAAPGPGPQ